MSLYSPINQKLSIKSLSLYKTATVIISYYSERPSDDLFALISSIETYKPGIDIELVIVVNQDTKKLLPKINTKYALNVFYRENIGMNIGAWDYGWRQYHKNDLFIFLQDECRVIRDDWALQIATHLSNSDIGLIGESINPKWDLSWTDLVLNPSFTKRANYYLKVLGNWGIDTGLTARHLQSLIWATTKDTLYKMNGFLLGKNYDECVASEIAVSKKIEMLGLSFQQIVPEKAFHFFAHKEWSSKQSKLKALEFDTTFDYGRKITLHNKNYKVKPRTDLFSLIDNDPLNVCEIGCADGTNLSELVKKIKKPFQKENLVGVDIAKFESLPEYKNFTFVHDTAENFVNNYAGAKFDLVILSDVIEHLYNPWKFMERLRLHLNFGARVLISVPNIQNLNYINATINGSFEYAKNGLFDVTHIRFFSVETLIQLIESAGYRLITQSFRPDKALSLIRSDVETKLECSSNVSLKLNQITLQIQLQNIDRYFAQQILLNCTPI